MKVENKIDNTILQLIHPVFKGIEIVANDTEGENVEMPAIHCMCFQHDIQFEQIVLSQQIFH